MAAWEDPRAVTELLRYAGSLLRLDPDPTHTRRAFAHVGGWALSHYGPSTDALRELGRRLEGQTGGALDVLTQLGAVLVRTFPVEPRLPRWSEVHRIGEPSPLLPFDPELVGLQLGTRRIAKRDELDEASAEAVTSWWRANGLETRRVDHCVFAARRPADLDEAEHWQGALTADERAASRALGERLGYPPCCVDAYLALDANDDVALACQLLPHDDDPASPLTLWLHAPLALVSHAPCSLRCEPTRQLARTLLEALNERHRGFAAQWMRAARRVHAFDADGDAWSFGEDQLRLDGNALVASPLEDVLRIDAFGLHVGARKLGLFADHRGEP